MQLWANQLVYYATNGCIKLKAKCCEISAEQYK